jgi:hypothetical protein
VFPVVAIGAAVLVFLGFRREGPTRIALVVIGAVVLFALGAWIGLIGVSGDITAGKDPVIQPPP